MVLVFIFCTILSITFLFIAITIFSTIRLKIENFYISNLEKQNSNNQKSFHIIFSLYLFNKIKWLSIDINSKRMRKIYNKVKLEKIDIKKIEQNFKLANLKELKRVEPKISLFDFELELGTEDAILTSFIVFFISTGISILLPYIMKIEQKDNCRYIIQPLHLQKNLYKMKLNCIIEVKMVHIISIIFVFLKKRRVNKNERTSNRSSYDYSYE